MRDDIALHIIRLVIGGGAAFLAIMLWPRTKDSAWSSLIAGFIVSYAGVVYDILASFGIIGVGFLPIGGMPFFRLLFAALPGIFFIIAFIIMLVKNK
jgi:hypothetical protein